VTSSPHRQTSLPPALTRWLALAARLPEEDRIAPLVLLAAALLRIFYLQAPVYNYDEGVYASSLHALLAGHPLYSSVYLAQPPLFLYILTPWYAALGQTLTAARIGVITLSLVGLGAMWWLGRTLAGPRVGLIALILLALDPLYLVQSKSVQAEAPALAVMLLALAVAATDVRWRAPVAGALFAASVLIKLFTVTAIIPFAYFLLFPLIRDRVSEIFEARRRPTRSDLSALWLSSRRAIAEALAGFVGITLLVFLPSAGHLGDAWSQIIGLHVSATGSAGQSRLANFSLFVQSWYEWPLILAGLAAGIASWRRRLPLGVMLAAWGIVCLLVLAIQKPLFQHHMVLLVPAFTLAAAQWVALGDMIHMGRWPQWLNGGRIASGVLGLVLAVAIVTTVVQQHAALVAAPPVETGAAAILDAFTLPGDLVVTDDQVAAVLANRDVPPSLADTSMVRIESGALTTQQVIAAASDPRVTAVLWLSGRFSLLPGLRAWVQINFISVAAFPGNGALYLRQKPPSHPSATASEGSP
jgi:4-amino-4-deoxy-L-arabinose transferase-like glycosyltransferase